MRVLLSTVTAIGLAVTAAPVVIGVAGQNSNDTVVNEQSFRLRLPGSWVLGDASDPHRRTFHRVHEQLTVSIFGALFGKPGEMDHENKVAKFKLWVGKRRAIEARAPEFAGIQLTETSFGESGGTLAARYSGLDTRRKRRFHCLILASSTAFESFYYEALDMSEQVVQDRAKEIFDSVSIPD